MKSVHILVATDEEVKAEMAEFTRANRVSPLAPHYNCQCRACIENPEPNGVDAAGGFTNDAG